METNRKVTMLACDLLGVPAKMAGEFYEIHRTFDQWITNEGNQGIKRAKAVFDWTLSNLLGENPQLPSWLKKSELNGVEVPRILEPVLEWIQSNPRLGLTLIRYSDLYPATLTDENCSNALIPIESPPESSISDDEVLELLDVANRYRLPKIELKPGSVPLFSKGPNGVSILNVYKDSIALHKEGQLDNVYNLGSALVHTTKGEFKLSSVVNSITDNFNSENYPELKVKSGRLVFLAEKSAKIRVIATGDYITQSILKPIHDTLAKVLLSIPSDWTFDQEGGKKWVQMMTSKSNWAASFDLSNATDRLPADLQAEMIDRVLPGNLGQLWLKVLKERQFHYTLPSGRDGVVQYSVGQPMGFFSSFVSFALLHHILVQYAFEKVHNKTYHSGIYAIIGDDIVIFDKRTALFYKGLISRIGGVINLRKSRLNNQRGETIAEFAKAYYVNGKNITPFSLLQIKDALNNWANVPNLYTSLRQNLGIVLSAKKLKKTFQDYWPLDAKTLVSLLEVPIELGGLGKPGHTPLATVLRGKSNTFRRYLAYRAFEAFRLTIGISDQVVSLATNDIDHRNRQHLRMAMEPFLKLLRDRSEELGIPHVISTRKGFLEWAMSSDTTLSMLISCVRLMIKDVPTTLREKVNRPSIMWVRALADDRKTSNNALIDSDDAYYYAFLDLYAQTKV